MKLIKIKKEHKVGYFDDIAAEFYNGNFGQLSKSDMEVLMFHFYLQELIDENKRPDGTIDYNKCSDYRIGKDLGITQQKVRSLKVKCQLKYPIDYKWEDALATLTRNARYDSVTHKVTLYIPDPNLYLDIQNFIEENGAYVEKQLNSKVLQLRAEYYIDLILSLEDQKTRDKVIKELKKTLKDAGKDDSALDESDIGRSLITSAVNLTTIAASISGLLSSSNVVGSALIGLLTKNK